MAAVDGLSELRAQQKWPNALRSKQATSGKRCGVGASDDDVIKQPLVLDSTFRLWNVPPGVVTAGMYFHHFAKPPYRIARLVLLHKGVLRPDHLTKYVAAFF